jgi:septal ring factor EnvC (AmiA/AmiB activator)
VTPDVARLREIMESLRRDQTSVGKYAIISDLLHEWDALAPALDAQQAEIARLTLECQVSQANSNYIYRTYQEQFHRSEKAEMENRSLEGTIKTQRAEIARLRARLVALQEHGDSDSGLFGSRL